MTTTTDDPLPDLLRTLRSRVPADRARAARNLGRLGWLAREALPALVRALDDEDAKVREAAAQAVGQMGAEALPALGGMLGHDDKYVRRHAVWALGKLGPPARPALGELARALKDADPRTASGAAQALGNLGAAGAAAVPPLAEAMRGTNIVLCRLAARALSQIGPPALATLMAHLQHTDPFVRGEAALAVGWMGAAARTAVPLLGQIVRGPHTRGLADTPPPAGTLARGAVSPPAVVSPNMSGVNSAVITPTLPPPTDDAATEETCRVYAAQALGRLGPAAAGAAADLRVASRFGSEPVRQAAATALRLVQGV
jgi:HEAT repeat protein